MERMIELLVKSVPDLPLTQYRVCLRREQTDEQLVLSWDTMSGGAVRTRLGWLANQANKYGGDTEAWVKDQIGELIQQGWCVTVVDVRAPRCPGDRGSVPDELPPSMLGLY
ncbi:hypothetical protein ITP53_43520 [Nonomuraea sp. K274]|uniref:Uncharacterized protein n=1 Tax=Nonomuraea cypriaca TaxID=1187855 RepID=A0A931F210_9ACTN|nr:hypothetical protein [Nonomuraea cypriaca]MBF8192439.1 hypothetical protein [Nonomuraea cypriaca]